ncbi:hypothetical protein CCC_00965 [Paramagnetospirillum magnetotacticum MS-1]|uniref:Uncharacterized protein n=1 Tax=Paramagnetospirillum magnetotacticum MS-1 TaxID=272627 RepID=A0A0C2YDX1_PARME|nr:hypothetical protein [Paramagnetospirillum magnetotacticum]KIL97904.1 hypothetical protein CCC_00965 [Paramagnetospirillum magnetotacticum MS-1]
MAMIVTDVIMTLAREKAEDDRVSLHDLERIAALICGGSMVLDAAYIRQEESCRKFHQLPKGNVGARSNPFHRLMVRPFEHLLTGDGMVLQRDYLPNYFEFLGHALEKRLDAFERHCRTIIQALMVVHGNNLTWDQFYADLRTVKTLQGALKLLRAYLEGPEGQRVWHGCMMRPVGDLPQPSVGQVNHIRQVLLETARGLEAAE